MAQAVDTEAYRGNGGTKHVPCGHFCQSGRRLDEVESGQDHNLAMADRHEHALLELTAEMGQVKERLGHAGVVDPDPMKSKPPTGHTKLLLDISSEVHALAEGQRTAMDSISDLELENQNTEVQSREELIERTHRAESLLLSKALRSTHPVSPVIVNATPPPESDWKKKAKDALFLVLIGFFIANAAPGAQNIFKAIRSLF